jgi:hypothetical protein
MIARVFVFALISGCAIAAAMADSPAAKLAPTRIRLKQTDATLADAGQALAKASGMMIEVDPRIARLSSKLAFTDVPFWDALEQIARDADAKIVIQDDGRKLRLEPRGPSNLVSAVSGPFRVVARNVIGRALLDAGATFHDILLDVHWEPRYPVYRIDTVPTIKSAKDDKGNNLLADSSISFQHPSGASAELRVKLTGLPRAAGKIAVLEGVFRATAAEKLLTIKFDDLTAKSAVTKTQDRVSIVLKPLTYDDSTKAWTAELELTYPEPHPVFQSFEEFKWLRDNRLQFVVAGKPVEPSSEEVAASGRHVTATYRFKGVNPAAKGTSLVLQAPGPLVELTVPFKLQNIPVP